MVCGLHKRHTKQGARIRLIRATSSSIMQRASPIEEHTQEKRGAPRKALKELDDPKPRPLINDRIEPNFDPDSVPDGSYDFFVKITGME